MRRQRPLDLTSGLPSLNYLEAIASELSKIVGVTALHRKAARPTPTKRRHANARPLLRKDLPLGSADPIERIKILGVVEAHPRDQRHIRRSDLSQPPDLPRLRHRHLQHHHLLIPTSGKNRERQAYLRIVVARSGKGAPSSLEQRLQKTLGRRLANRPRHPNHQRTQLRKPLVRQLLQMKQRIGNADQL